MHFLHLIFALYWGFKEAEEIWDTCLRVQKQNDFTVLDLGIQMYIFSSQTNKTSPAAFPYLGNNNSYTASNAK